MAKFGIAVVGCGSIANIAHFPSISRTPEAELIAVRTEKLAKLRELGIDPYGAKFDITITPGDLKATFFTASRSGLALSFSTELMISAGNAQNRSLAECKS